MGQRSSVEALSRWINPRSRSPLVARAVSSDAVLTQVPPYAAAARLPVQQEVEPADSPLEAEADQAARQMVGGAPSDRPAPPEEPNAGVPTLQAGRSTADGSAPVGPGLSQGIEAARSGGQELPAVSRTFFESRLGQDLSAVRLHTGRQADELSSSIQARAFTSGHDVFFRAGEYQPGSTTGQSLLAHELTHVAQQDNSKPVSLAQRVAALTPRWADRRPITRSPLTIQRARPAVCGHRPPHVFRGRQLRV